MAAYTGTRPFPYDVLESAGGGFAVGALGSAPFHLFKAAKGSRLQYMAMKAPKTAGAFAVWAGLFQAMSTGIAHARGKEDPWNSILAGGATCGLLACRKGVRAATGQMLVGGALMALIEGVNIMVNQQVQNQQLGVQGPAPAPIPAPAAVDEPRVKTRFFRRWLGGKKEKEEAGLRVLESLDTPTPMPTTFQYN